MIRVDRLFRHPVKSMLGESVERAELTPNGIPGDRAWALKDEVQGALTGGKRFPLLMGMAAEFLLEPDAARPSAPVRIHASGGDRRDSSDGDVNAWLSRVLEHPVSLWPLLPATAEAHYRRAAAAPDADMQAELRAVFARTPDEPLPDLAKFPPELFTHAAPPGTYFDAYPLLIMSRSALEALGALARAAGYASNFDVRRFRPNILVDGAATGFVEDAWVGRRIRVGSAVLEVAMACPRCIMTTHGFLDLPRDPKVMRALVQLHGGNLGVYASVAEPGAIAVGDPVDPI